MARPIYSHEVLDPDFQWLINSCIQSNPNAILIDQSCVPIVMLLIDERTRANASNGSEVPLALPAGEDSIDESDPVSDDT